MSLDKSLTPTDKLALKLRDQGLTFPQITEKLNADGHKTNTGLPIRDSWVQSRMHWLKETGRTDKFTPTKKHSSGKDTITVGTIPRKYTRRNKMIEIPIAKEEGKICAVIGTADQIKEILKGL